MRLKAGILLVLIWSVLFLDCSLASTRAGRVLAVKRNVLILRDSSSLKALPDSPLFINDTVVTAEASRAKLYFIDDSVLNLSENSRLIVKEYLYNPRKKQTRAVYKLLKGIMKVFSSGTELQIHTPTALASVRGTSFLIWVDENTEATYLYVIDGEVIFRNIIGGPSIVVKTGQVSTVMGRKPPRLIKTFNKAKLKRVKRKTAVMGRVSIHRKPVKIRRPQLARPVPRRLKRHLWQRPPEDFSRIGVKIVFP